MVAILSVPAWGQGEDASRVLFFPYLFESADDVQPEYIFEFVTMVTHPLDGEIIADDFFSYEYGGTADLGIVYSNGYSTHAYAEQYQADNLYGYHISFGGLSRDDVAVVKTFESGVQWPEAAFGTVKEANLVAGDTFYLMMEILQDGGYLPYSRTEIDCTGLALGESITAEATFDLEEYQGESFTITVTKLLWLRRPLEEPVEAPQETANPAAILDLIDQAMQEQAQQTREIEESVIVDEEVPLAGPEVSITAPSVSLVMPSLPEVIGTAEVTNEYNVNLRALPDQESERVTVLHPGERHSCVGIAVNGWYELLLDNGLRGYVSPKMVAFTPR